MGAGAKNKPGYRRVLATWLALMLLAGQTLLAAGLAERPMAPFAVADQGIVVCTEHGREIVPFDGSAPIHDSSDHSVSCPCCLPFSAHGGGAILADAVPLAAPGLLAASFDAPDGTSPRVARVSPGPQQPRAPPVSV